MQLILMIFGNMHSLLNRTRFPFNIPMDIGVEKKITNPYWQVTRGGYVEDWQSTLNSMVSLDQDFSFITEGLKANIKFAFDTQAWHGNKYTQQDEIWHAIRVIQMENLYSTQNRKLPKEVHGLIISRRK